MSRDQTILEGSYEVSLTSELEKLVQETVTSGPHQTASEVIRESLRLLKQRDDQNTALRELIQHGFAPLDQGAYQKYTDDTLPELGQEIKQHGRQHLADRPLS
jgi:antitoxin ParD1/3/4